MTGPDLRTIQRGLAAADRWAKGYPPHRHDPAEAFAALRELAGVLDPDSHSIEASEWLAKTVGLARAINPNAQEETTE
jgi:hypothetical protein